MRRQAREYACKALSVLTAALVLGGFSTHLRAEGPPLPAPSKKLDLLPPGGATSSGMVRFDWAATSFGVERSHFVNAMGFGVSFTPCTPRIPEGMRFFNIGGMLYVGDYGDSRRGPISGQLAYNPEFRVWNASVISAYVGTPFAWTFSPIRKESRIGHVFSAGAALGIELLNGGIGVEGSFAMAFAPGDVFRPLNAAGGKVWEPRGQLTLSTNICGFLGAGGFCEHDAPQSAQVDLTEALKAAFQISLVPTGTGAGAPPVCAAVAQATSVVTDDTVEPKCELTRVDEQFFCRLKKASAQQPYSQAVDEVSKLHDALTQCYRQYQADTAAASSQHRMMNLAEQYLVDPSEVRRVLQCEPNADPYVRDSTQLKLVCQTCPRVRDLEPALCK
jgi:hypothetical protein